MLTDAARRIAISNLGWIDRGSLWTFAAVGQRPQTIPLGSARFLTLRQGTGDHFSVVHHHDGARIEITVHHFADAGTVIARAVIEPDASTLSGAHSAWAHVPTNYTAFCRSASWSDYALIQIDPLQQRVGIHRFEWFNDDYDKGQQGVTGVTEVPGTPLLLISIQRSSRVIVHDPVRHTRVGTIELAGRAGNAGLFVRRHAPEVWAEDYDTVLKLETGSWRILASRRLQGWSWQATQQFIGGFWFDPEETLCMVARPFSGDVVGLDPADLLTRWKCKTGRQPIEAVVLRDGAVLARDWKTGDLLEARLPADDAPGA